MIKVLHTEWSINPGGGQEIRTINEMIAVRDRGIELYLACREGAGIQKMAEKNNFKVFTLPFKGQFDIKTILGLRKIIKEYNIDIVNTHSGKDTWCGGLAAKLAGAKFIRTRHLGLKIGTSRLNFINELADFIFTTGETVRSNMINENRIKPEKIQSIPTGQDPEVFDPSKYDRDECRNKFNIEKDEIAIGYIAVLRGAKRHDNFLKTAKRLIRNYPDKKFTFIIAGGGGGKERIENLITEMSLSSHVNMLGHVDNVPEVLTALDIVVSTSEYEGVPQSIMQALFMNKLVVTTNAGSTPDLYNGNNFLMSDPDVDKVYENLAKAVENIDKENFLDNSRNFMIEEFSIKVLTDKIVDIYNKLLKK